jgi:hypothetical protein
MLWSRKQLALANWCALNVGAELIKRQTAMGFGALGRRTERLAQNYTGVRKLLPGPVAWSEAIKRGVERGKRNVTFKVLCLSCDGLACDGSHDHPGPSSLGPIAACSIGKWTGPRPRECSGGEA